MSWIMNNVEWLFGGVGVFVVAGIAKFFMKKNETSSPVLGSVNITNQNSFHGMPSEPLSSPAREQKMMKKSIEEYKNETRILFIDDDVRFKVAKILINSGWVHTKLIKDARSLDDRDVIEASILFIDVQGVGIALGFSDEGLGLAEAIKDKYPNKKVIIYSAETKGDRFHKALRKADSFLSKNADPYEFQKIVEEFTVGEE